MDSRANALNGALRNLARRCYAAANVIETLPQNTNNIGNAIGAVNSEMEIVETMRDIYCESLGIQVAPFREEDFDEGDK